MDFEEVGLIESTRVQYLNSPNKRAISPCEQDTSSGFSQDTRHSNQEGIYPWQSRSKITNQNTKHDNRNLRYGNIHRHREMDTTSLGRKRGSQCKGLSQYSKRLQSSNQIEASHDHGRHWHEQSTFMDIVENRELIGRHDDRNLRYGKVHGEDSHHEMDNTSLGRKRGSQCRGFAPFSKRPRLSSAGVSMPTHIYNTSRMDSLSTQSRHQREVSHLYGRRPHDCTVFSNRTGRNHDSIQHKESIDQCINRLCNIPLRSDRDFEDFYLNHLDNLDSIASSKELGETQVRSVMSLLMKFELKSNAKLCCVIRNSNILNRPEVYVILSTLLNGVSQEEINGKDMEFLQAIKSVISILADDENTRETDIRACLNLLKSIMPNVLAKHGEASEVVQQQLISIELKFDKSATVRNEATSKISSVFSTELQDVCKWEILPSSSDIQKNKTPPLVPHGLEQAFKSDAHYLVTQFYLFLEDFIGPLRRGIQEYMKYTFDPTMKSRFKDDNIRLYRRVRLLQPRFLLKSGIVWDVQFDVGTLKNIRWDSCKFLQYGNLVCLTYNGCEHLAYAEIVDRDTTKLKNGVLSLKFFSLQNVGVLLRVDSSQLVLLETKSFFPVYHQALSILKSKAKNMLLYNEGIPFSKHLVSYDRNVSEPSYLCDKDGQSIRVDFSSLLQYGTKMTPTDFSKVPILSKDSWPSADDLGLDISQYDAIQMCLTRKLGIIQGPPGTGKTLMGLRIIEFLMYNQTQFKSHAQRPILLVSHTNHALDQVLEAIIDKEKLRHLFTRGKHPLVRVGSRSESVRLQSCTLVAHRKNMKKLHSNKIFYNLRAVTERVEKIRFCLEHLESCILHENYLFREDIIPEHIYLAISEKNWPIYIPENRTKMLEWLQIPIQTTDYQWNNDTFSQNVHVPSEFEYFDFESHGEENYRRILDDDFDEDDLDFCIDSCMAVSRELLIPNDKNRLMPFWKQFNLKTRERVLAFISDKIKRTPAMSCYEVGRIDDVWSLHVKNRWRLYRYWITDLRKKCKQKEDSYTNDLESLRHDYDAEKEKENVMIMKNAKLIGMTTTGAIQNIDVLKKVGPCIMIVEEAAQVHEQHILACLSCDIQHLILIGDHQQLRPAVNDYSLVKTHHTDVSMMERLVLNKIPFQRLTNQHRMRPEISQLLTPEIYTDLVDHDSVKHYSRIKGTEQDVFFVDHHQPESQSEYSTSHKNEHEANFIARLYLYLRQQGYQPSVITIISPYNDQVRLLRKTVKDIEDKIDNERYSYAKGVRITAVDNFQGEENDIILLSLVRSNKEKSIGHLHDRKRICVSLSRAKKGFFAIGNFQMLKERSKCWNKILSKAGENKMVGKTLRLKCQIHDTITEVSKASDFDKAIDGGCSLPCETQLQCGHVCEKKCHADRNIHLNTCKKVCLKECVGGHPCKKLCYEPCGNCEEIVTKTLIQCGHQVETQCYKDHSELKCTQRCTKILECGHQCQTYCGKTCNTVENCNELVKVKGLCTHEFQVPCCTKDFPVCTVPCNKMLDCGHKCRGKCGVCSMGRLHISCQEKCKRILFCGHICKTKHSCSSRCPPCKEECQTSCSHRGRKGCPNKCGDKCLDCREPCGWKCVDTCKNRYQCTMLCYQECNRPPCNEPCRKKLKCKHECVGLCTEPCPRLCRICNKDELCQIIFGTEDEINARFIQLSDCNHIFEVTAFDKYMGISTEEDCPDQDQSTVVKLNYCPICKIPIRRSYRYANVIKKVLNDLKKIKDKIAKEGIALQSDFSKSEISKKVFGTLNEIDYRFTKTLNDYVRSKSNDSYEVGSKKMVLLNSLASQYCVGMGKLSQNESHRNEIKIQLYFILQWILIQRRIFSGFELQQYSQEVERFSLLIQYFVLDENIRKTGIEDLEKEREEVQKAIIALRWPMIIQDEQEQKIKETLGRIKQKVPDTGLGISDEERNMILKAMAFSKGHWYKCKNGHVYAIGDCGGAMEQSKCPECKTEIGGSNHRLREDNCVATEMDGSKYAAWSEQANMENYEL